MMGSYHNMNSSSTSTDCKDIISDMVFEDVAYKNISDENLKSWIVQCLFNSKPFGSYDELLNKYDISNIMYKINNARFSSLQSLIEKYADALEITSSDTYKQYVMLVIIPSKLKEKQHRERQLKQRT